MRARLTRYLARQAFGLLTTPLAASVLVFAVLRVLPGDAATVALGVNATPDALAAWRAAHGTDRPLVVQYLTWLGALVRGDFGRSFLTGRALTPVIFDRLQVTLILVGLAMLLALAVAVPLGSAAAVTRRPMVAAALSGASQVGVAVPSFLVGLALVSAFAVRLGWLPASGWVPPAFGFVEFLRRLILPVLTLALVQAALLTRYQRSAVLEVLGQDYLRTALATGHTPTSALVRLGLRNAAVPVAAVVGVQLSAMLIGAVVVERVFLVPGIGSLLVDAVFQRDLVAVQGIVMVLVALVVVINYLTDVALGVIDPRLRAWVGP